MGVLTEPSLSGPVTVNNTVPISKVGTITPGLIGSAEIPARTTFQLLVVLMDVKQVLVT